MLFRSGNGGAELAIVTAIPGTTRDKVSQTIQIEGVPLHITDTAGLRDDAADEVERIGVSRSWDAIGEADVVLFLIDARAGILPLDEAFASWLRKRSAKVILVANKCEGRAGQTAVSGHVNFVTAIHA